MTDSTISVARPVPRWVRAWAILTLALGVVLLTVGGFVTSFRAGMADPVWPTEPWYLAENFKLDLGYLVEHTHRIVAFAVGGCAIVLAIGAWLYEPEKRLRPFGLAAIVFLCLVFGAFHGAMMHSWKEEKRLTGLAIGTGVATLAGVVALLSACCVTGAGRQPGRWVRALAGVSLVAVMIQGLLGGLRVFLNELIGTDLAAVHGVFAQVTFCLLVAVAILAAPRRTGDALAVADRPRFLRLSAALVGLLFVQLVWAVFVRHQGSEAAQRLHLLTAFAVTGVAVWLSVLVLASPPVKARLGGQAYHLLGLLALQLMLGVEAYMGKFAAAGPQAQVPPMLRDVRPDQAATRTAHQLIGSGLLAAAVALALRVRRQPVVADRPKAGPGEDTVVLAPLRSPDTAPVLR
jgi:heme A synthase